MAFSIMTLSMMTFSIMTLSIMTLSIMILCVMTFSIIINKNLLSVTYKPFMLSVVILSVVAPLTDDA
jgi:hypothetical protein